MSRKVVVITGSPRRNGNSTAMAEAFIREAEKKGHKVTRFDAAFMKLGGCHACESCFKSGKACTFDDDFNTIAPALMEADDIIFAMPVYWYTIPAQIKCSSTNCTRSTSREWMSAEKAAALLPAAKSKIKAYLTASVCLSSVQPHFSNGR